MLLFIGIFSLIHGSCTGREIDMIIGVLILIAGVLVERS